MTNHTLVFDVNETLLDLSALDPHFERGFGDAGARERWFEQVVQSALLGVVTDAYTDFGSVARGALRMTAARYGVRLTEEDEAAILGGIRTLPPHPEVPGALSRLQAAGVRMAALTNSTLEVAEAQLQGAGLRGFFERVLSADTVKRLKPARVVYAHAAEELSVPTSGLRLVAAHAWDLAGALRAGCAGAFVERPGKVLDPLALQPDVVGKDLSEVADQLLAS